MNGLKAKYVEKMEMEIIPYDSARGQRAKKKYDMSHGMVILYPDGEIYWQKPGHKISKQEIVSNIKGVLRE